MRNGAADYTPSVSLWLRVRRVPHCIAILLVTLAIYIPTRDLMVPLPEILGYGVVVPFVSLLPLTIAIAAAWGLTTGDPVLEAVAARPLRVLDTAFIIGNAGAALVLFGIVYLLGGGPQAVAAGRNAVGYVGLTLLGRWVAGPQAAALLPVGVAIGTGLVGMGPQRQPRFWAWPLEAATDPVSWAFAFGLLVLGTAAALLAPPPVSADR